LDLPHRYGGAAYPNHNAIITSSATAAMNIMAPRGVSRHMVWPPLSFQYGVDHSL